MTDWTRHGAGVVLGTKTFCAECLKQGHHCEAVEDGTLCAFCEDGVECPITQRYKREQQANEFACGSGRDSESSKPGEAGSPKHSTPKPHAIQKIPGPTNQPGEATMAKLCKCGCEGELSPKAAERGWEYLYGHKPTAKNLPITTETAAAAEKPAAPKKKATWKRVTTKLKTIKPKKNAAKDTAVSKQAPETHRDDVTVSDAVLVFSEDQLVRMFNTLPIDDKVNCLQAYLNGVRA